MVGEDLDCSSFGICFNRDVNRKLTATTSKQTIIEWAMNIGPFDPKDIRIISNNMNSISYLTFINLLETSDANEYSLMYLNHKKGVLLRYDDKNEGEVEFDIRLR